MPPKFERYEFFQGVSNLVEKVSRLTHLGFPKTITIIFKETKLSCGKNRKLPCGSVLS